MNIVKEHKWFVKKSSIYIEDYGWTARLYYPIAYIKFMWYTFKDVLSAR